MQRTFDKLNFREQTLLEKRLATCMTCWRVGSWKNAPHLRNWRSCLSTVQLTVRIELTGNGGQVDGVLACQRCAPCCPYETGIIDQALKENRRLNQRNRVINDPEDCYGEWREISFDFKNGIAESIRLDDLYTMKTNRFEKQAKAYLLNCENEKLPKGTKVVFKP